MQYGISRKLSVDCVVDREDRSVVKLVESESSSSLVCVDWTGQGDQWSFSGILLSVSTIDGTELNLSGISFFITMTEGRGDFDLARLLLS